VVSLPGGTCLRCAGVIRDDLLGADREEYVASAPEQQVVSMNGLLASEAVTAAIFLITGCTPGYDVPAHLIYDGLAHELRKNRFLPHACSHYALTEAGWRAVLPPRRALYSESPD
jgi:molybdopterin-synthase adenylyltransferase